MSDRVTSPPSKNRYVLRANTCRRCSPGRGSTRQVDHDPPARSPSARHPTLASWALSCSLPSFELVVGLVVALVHQRCFCRVQLDQGDQVCNPVAGVLPDEDRRVLHPVVGLDG